MKLLKTLGKILAIPFMLFRLLVLMCLLPVAIIIYLLRGEINECRTKVKYSWNSIKALFKALRTDGEYFSHTVHSFIDSNDRSLIISEMFVLKNGNIEHNFIYNDSQEQKD